MIDLETMSLESNAAIVAIGAVKFNLETFELGEKFYMPVDLASSVAAGGHIDPGTVLWWMQQPESARKAAYDPDRCHIEDALGFFASWIRRGTDDAINVWGNGAAFDNVVLTNAYKRSKMEVPWGYKGNCCYRTIKLLNPEVPLEEVGTEHHALDDAVTQALHLMRIFGE